MAKKAEVTVEERLRALYDLQLIAPAYHAEYSAFSLFYFSDQG